MEKFFSKIRVTRGFEHKLSKYLGDSVCVGVGGGGWCEWVKILSLFFDKCNSNLKTENPQLLKPIRK